MEKDIFDKMNRISKYLFSTDNVRFQLHSTGEEITISDDGKVDFPDGTLIDCTVGNIINMLVVSNGEVHAIEMDQTFEIITEKFTFSEGEYKWKKVGEGDPNKLIYYGNLKEYDIIRFVNINGECIPCIPELGLGDMSGVFYVGRSVHDMETSMYEIFRRAMDNDDDDDEDEDNKFDYTEDDLEIIPASPIIEYLHKYGSMIRTAAKAVDMMDEYWQHMMYE